MYLVGLLTVVVAAVMIAVGFVVWAMTDTGPVARVPANPQSTATAVLPPPGG